MHFRHSCGQIAGHDALLWYIRIGDWQRKDHSGAVIRSRWPSSIDMLCESGDISEQEGIAKHRPVRQR